MAFKIDSLATAILAAIATTLTIGIPQPSLSNASEASHPLETEYSDRWKLINSRQQQPQQPLPTPNFQATNIPDSKDGAIFSAIITQAQQNNWQQQDFSSIIQQVSEQLLGSEYVAGLLDKSATETLVISLQKFDCMLFLESVLAIARNITSQDRDPYDYNQFTQNVAEQRYANGELTDYCSRLHYFSHWIDDNQQRGLVTNITADIGGVTEARKLDFMTQHRTSYNQLKSNDANYDCIAKVEQNLNQLPFSYIPTEKITTIYDQLKPGDIIGIATKIKGLDFTHTGLVYRDRDGNTGLIHASPAGSVVIAQDLQTYVANVPQARGIVVARASY